VRVFLQALGLVLLAAAASAQIDPKTAILEQTGFEALRAGEARRAAEAFRDALSADPKNARLHFGAGVAAFLERRDDDAKGAFERAIALNPRFTDARRFLGQVLHRQGDLLSAIRTYETVVADAPGDEVSVATLERWRREQELHDRMQQAVGHHFTVAFEGPAEEELAARALESLDRAYWRIGEALGIYPANPIPVVLYTTEQFRDITRSPMWAAGAYDGTIRVPMRGALAKGEELDRVLAHEFTHAVVRSLSHTAVPTWLNEGLAAAFESDGLAWAESVVRRAGHAMPLEALVKSFGRLGGTDAELAYASSAIAVRRLVDEAGGVAVANLLRDLGEGAEFEAAFAHRIQRPFAEFVESLATGAP
jgi:tetratricopeptide (TPR) repeat protein